MVRNSSSPNNFPPIDQLSTWSYIPFDIANSSGVGYVNGLYPIGFGNGKINPVIRFQVPITHLVENLHPTLNPDGWADMAINLEEHTGKYVQLKFVLKHNSGTGAQKTQPCLVGLLMDFRIGNPLPQSGVDDSEGLHTKAKSEPRVP